MSRRWGPVLTAMVTPFDGAGALDPDAAQAMFAAFAGGDVRAARALNAQLMASFEFVNSDSSVFPMSIKAMLRTLGLQVGECRLPLPPAPAHMEQRAREVWARLVH